MEELYPTLWQMFVTLFGSCHYFRYPGLPYNLVYNLHSFTFSSKTIFSGESMSLIRDIGRLMIPAGREHPLCMIAATLEMLKSTSPPAGKLLVDKVVPSV